MGGQSKGRAGQGRGRGRAVQASEWVQQAMQTLLSNGRRGLASDTHPCEWTTCKEQGRSSSGRFWADDQHSNCLAGRRERATARRPPPAARAPPVHSRVCAIEGATPLVPLVVILPCCRASSLREGQEDEAKRPRHRSLASAATQPNASTVDLRLIRR